ncbi:MAG: hypothetical protein JRH20_18660 [Deltaproteobacteria bacterium]|nr:hypothetical protein [Deltaproteobacteria bacterium]
MSEVPAPLSKRKRLGGFFRSRDGILLLGVLLIGSWAYVSLPDHHGRRGGVAELDGYYYYVYLRSMQMDGDLDFHNEYREWGNPFRFGDTATGRARNVFGVGPALLWSPFFGVAQLAAGAGRALGYPIAKDGLSRFHQRITFFGSLLYGWLALLFCYWIARRLFSPRLALFPALGAALAGPLPYYCLAGSSYSHAAAAMATSLAVLVWVSSRDAWTLRRWAGFGAALGLAVLARPAAAPLLLLLLWEAIRVAQPQLAKRAWKPALMSCLGPGLAALMVLLVFSPQLAVWTYLHGSPFVVPQGEGFLWWSSSAWASTLFAPRNGLFPSAPLMLVAVLGLFAELRHRRQVSLMLLTVFAALVFLNGAVHDWWGWSFSARRYSLALPLFTVGLARVIHGTAWLVGVVILGAVTFNLEWTRQFTQKNLNWYSVRSSEGLYMQVTHGLMEHVYDVMGNPLSLPAALTFSLQHGAPPRSYDRIEGNYLLGESNPRTLPAANPYLHATILFSAPYFRPHLSPNFGSRQLLEGVPYTPLRDPGGYVLLPINRPGKVTLWLRVRAVVPKTRLNLSFNGHALIQATLDHQGWTTVRATIPATMVRRGINRLNLDHDLPPDWNSHKPQNIGSTGVHSPVSLAVASGGKRAGKFCDLWLGPQVFRCSRGINLAIIDPKSGALLARRVFDAHNYPVAYGLALEFLESFPSGSLVLLGTRDDVGKHFAHGGAALLSRFGATSNLSKLPEGGYAAIGVLGAAPGSAVEELVAERHARARVGNLPPSWREAVRYSALRLR